MDLLYRVTGPGIAHDHEVNEMIRKPKLIIVMLPLLAAGMLMAAGNAEPQRHRRQRRAHQQSRKHQRQMRHVLGHHADFAFYDADGDRFAVIKQGGERLIGMFTAEYSEAEGYRGITNSLVLLDLQGVIREVKVVDSEDTPPYVRRVVRKGFLEQFKELKPGDSPEVDAVTGATMTCEAIEQSVKETLEAFSALTDRVDFSGTVPRGKTQKTTVKRLE